MIATGGRSVVEDSLIRLSVCLSVGQCFNLLVSQPETKKGRHFKMQTGTTDKKRHRDEIDQFYFFSLEFHQICIFHIAFHTRLRAPNSF